MICGSRARGWLSAPQKNSQKPNMSALLQATTPLLRPMHDADVGAVMGIENRVYPFPWTAGIFSDCIHVGYCCWICEKDEEVIGYAVMSIGAGEAHILNLCVEPLQQRRGIGSLMLSHLVELAQQHHASSMFLEVRPTNKGAISLYHAMAFTEVGTRKDYYPATKGRENALILERKLKS